MIARQTKVPMPAMIAALYPNPSTKKNIIFYAVATKVRDALILQLEDYRSEPFCRPFQNHLDHMAPTALDQYSHIEFNLIEYNVIVHITTDARQHDLVYTIRHINRLPNKELRRRPFFCF